MSEGLRRFCSCERAYLDSSGLSRAGALVKVLPNLFELREVVLQAERTLPQARFGVLLGVSVVQLVALRLTVNETDDLRQDQLPDVERFARFLRQNIEEFLARQRLKERPEIFVAAVQLVSNVIERYALVSQPLALKLDGECIQIEIFQPIR